MDNQLVKIEQQQTEVQTTFGDSASFEHAQRVAKMLSSSNLIPKEYQGNIQNTMIALEMANRIGATPLMVMQNLYIIHGKPSWSSSFIIAAINACKKFSPLRFSVSGEGDGLGCFAWAYDIETKDKLEGPAITIGMAKKEGWFTKTGSKWQTMPELMLRYRSAAFFGRLYAPEILMGMHTTEEIQDVVESHGQTKIDKEAERIQLLISDCTTKEELENLKPYVMESQLDLFNSKLQEVEK
jgi:hypothetical protein